MNKNIKIVINVVLMVAVVFLAIKFYNNMMQPIDFKKDFKYRSDLVKEKMMKIREVELAYLDQYNKFTSDFDSLISFVQNDSLKVIKAEGEVPDSLYLKYGKKEAEIKALAFGIISRDTIKVSVKDSLFQTGNCDTLRFVPYSNLTEEFQLQAGILTTLSKLKRPVFELKVHNNTFTESMPKKYEQSVINLNDAARDNEKFPGLIIGSMFEVSTSGNWD